MQKLLKILRKNARLSAEELAVMTGRSPEEIAAQIAELERNGVIRGYSAVIDDSAFDDESVLALIELKVTPQSQSGFDEIADRISAYEEVESVRLMSGGYDILVSVIGRNIRDISQFVNQRLAAIDAVQSTTTHFVLKSYKENGIIKTDAEKDERGFVSP
ncbi:MAG: Lrp/AsnC family transcriptional regulator [Ruminococcus sp.]|nr:Lrp/AsnC family transcriptional regulator [Ruminococcus sp.]